MFEGVFIGRYTTEEIPQRIHEGDIVAFEFKEPGKHTGFQLSKAKGVIKFNTDRSAFDILVKSDEWDYNTDVESKYGTQIDVCAFVEQLDKYPIVKILKIEGTMYESGERFDYQEIKETIDELVFLRDVSQMGFSKKAKFALFSSIEILNKVKSKFLNENDNFGIKKLYKYTRTDGVSSYEAVVIAKNKQEAADIVKERYEIHISGEDVVEEIDVTNPVLMFSSF